jgi:two-component system, cell cycle response regulator
MERKLNRPAEDGFFLRILRRLQIARRPDAYTVVPDPHRAALDADKVQCANPGAVIGAMDFNGAWMESRLRGNERIWAGFREIELRMLAAETLHAVIAVLARDLPEFFPGVHAVSIAWLDPDYELTHLLELEGDTPTQPIAPITASGKSSTAITAPGNSVFVALRPPLHGQIPPDGPLLGAVDPASQERLFPHTTRPLQSMAITPLVLRGERVGSLNQGSADPRHFTPDAATDLLEHLSAVAAICIDNAVNRARLRRDGLTDMLTQVANRRFFDRRLREEISQWRRRGGDLSCLLVDLDCFKQINDQHGHQAGDLVLQDVARTLGMELRASDVLARYGGEEFVLLLPATGSELAAEIAERLRTAVAELTHTLVQGASLRVTASFGLASLAGGQRAMPDDIRDGGGRPRREQAVEDPGLWLLRHADHALYTAKARGRNCVVVADGSDAGMMAPLAVVPSAPGER